MRAVILDGSEKNDRSLGRARESIREALAGIGWQVRALPLCEMEIAPCRGCLDCWTRTPGLCRIEDQGRDVPAAICSSDLAVLLSPVVFGGLGFILKNALDRCLGLQSPFLERKDGGFRNKARYRRNPSLLGVGLAMEIDPEAQRIFSAMVAELSFLLHAPRFSALVLPSRHSPAAAAGQVKAALAAMGVKR